MGREAGGLQKIFLQLSAEVPRFSFKGCDVILGDGENKFERPVYYKHCFS